MSPRDLYAKFNKIIIYVLLLFLPSQLAIHFWPEWSYVFGLRIDFLSPAVYLTDILVFLILFMNLRLLKIPTHLSLFFLVLASLNIYFSDNVGITIYKWVKMAEFIFFGLFIARQKSVRVNNMVKIVFYAAVPVSIIGIMQFVRGGTAGGIFYLLGERDFNQSTPGIALLSLNGAEHLRAYSTFSHPNSLAGYLGVILIAFLLRGGNKRNFINLTSVITVIAAMLTTFSITAYFGLLTVLFFLTLSKYKLVSTVGPKLFLYISTVGSLLLPLITPKFINAGTVFGSNVLERLDLALMAGKMVAGFGSKTQFFLENFIFGIGAGSFIVHIPQMKGIFTYSWLLQPVHNIFLLVFVEYGIIIFLIFLYFLYKLINTAIETKQLWLAMALVFILFTGLADHYWVSLQQNTLLLSLIAGITLNKDFKPNVFTEK